MSGSRALNFALLGLSVWAAAAGGARAQDLISLEHEKKAKYLIYFGSGYVTWPPEPFPGADKQFVIGILGRDRFGAHLQTYEGKQLSDGRRIVVRRFASMDQYRSCHILYISHEPAEGRAGETPLRRLDAALTAVREAPVLIVSESPGLAKRGACINFVADAATGLIKMDINRSAERRASLTISSRLLKLENVVRIVKEEGA